MSSKKVIKEFKREDYSRIDAGMSTYEFKHEGRRVVVFYSSKRACYQKHQREFILDKIKKLTDREGKVSNNKLSSNKGMKRYLERCKGFTKIKKDAILEDEKWDGIFGICTNIKDISAKELYSSYKKLWKIEESFRINN